MPEPTQPDVNAVMTSYFETFDRRVIEDIVPLYTADVHADISGLGMLDGIDEVRDDWLVPFTSAFPDYTHTVNSITVEGQRATADFVFSGTHQGPLFGYEPTGKQLTLPIMGEYDIVGGAVSSFTLEYDAAVVVAAISP
jgi:predicted ester cyclase